MKKTLLIIFLLGLSTMTEAQIIVNSTQASTIRIREKSSRQKGFVLRTDIGVGHRLGDPNDFDINLSGNIGYQLNPYITLGGGLGINILLIESSAIPFYFDVKGYFSNRVWSPYYNIKLGYSTNIYYYHNDYRIIRLGGRAYFATALGMNYKNFDFGIELSLMGSTERHGYPYYHNITYSSLNLKFGYNFPLYKKKE